MLLSLDPVPGEREPRRYPAPQPGLERQDAGRGDRRGLLAAQQQE